jgi:hypothetical protein
MSSADPHSPPLPPEPETPAWLTGVGIFLFFVVGAWLLTVPSDSKKAGATAPAASGQAAPAQSAPAH